MIVFVQASVLSVGLEKKSKVLKELPIRVIEMNTGTQAAQCLKKQQVHSVISNWDLEDMPNGRFLKGLRAAKPHIPTIIFTRSGDQAQEIEARSLGASAVLTDQTTDEQFKETVANVLGLKSPVSIKAIIPAKTESSLYQKEKVTR